MVEDRNSLGGFARVVAGLAAVCLVGAPLASQGGGELEQRAAEALERHAEASSGAELQALANELAGIGPDGVPVLFALLHGGRYEASDGSRVVLGAPAREALLSALWRLPEAALLDFLEGLATARAPVAARTSGLRLLTHGAGVPYLDLAFRMASPDEPASAVHPRLRGELRAFVVALLEEDEGAGPWLLAAYAEAPPGLCSPVLRALSERGDEAALLLLARLLGRQPALDPLVLVELGRAAGRRRELVDPEVADSVRPYLEDDDQGLVIEACRALGKLGDDAAVPVLIELLEEESRAVRDGAHRALRAISGRAFQPTARHWWAWYERERSWWEEESERCLTALRSNGPRVPEAILALSRRRLYRHERAQALAEILDHGRPEWTVLACSVLTSLDSLEAVPALRSLTDHPDDRVRAAALQALSRITRSPLPAPSDSSS